MANYNWLEVRTPRSVNELRPWPENPRLNPDSSPVTLTDYIEDLISDNGDKDSFIELIKSIAERGFIPADPIVVWQNASNQKFYVAEGNRRVLALKVLLYPNRAPRSIRGIVRKYAAKINPNNIKKIRVCVAPSFEEAEWYINQRNSTSSLQRSWSRVQQQRWIKTLYEKYSGDIDHILSVTDLNKSEIEGFIRNLKLKDFIDIPVVKGLLTEEEYESANSYKFPITILERFFNYSDVKDRWGVEFNGVDIAIKSNINSFYAAYAQLIKRIVNEGPHQINTRFKGEDIGNILDSLPEVSFDEKPEDAAQPVTGQKNDDNAPDSNPEPTPVPPAPPKPQKNDPNRSRLILPIYRLDTDSAKLLALFNELKSIPIRYENSIAAAIRIFLDLAVLNYIQAENIETAIAAQYKCGLRDVQLGRRLEYLKQNKLSGKAQTIVGTLLTPENQYSLDVLNGYIHSNETHYSGRQFLNCFWDFLFPLFEQLLAITEEN
jgi:hypothetical protein